MLYSLLPIKIYSVLFASCSFLFAFLGLKFCMRLLPKDQGREFAVNGTLSEGKPRGAGIVFITGFVLSSVLFIPLNPEQIINLALIYAAMMTGYLDDAAEKPRPRQPQAAENAHSDHDLRGAVLDRLQYAAV